METGRRETLDRLYETRDQADLEIACGPKIFKVHADVVRAGSRYFTAAFFGGFKEARTKRINLEEDPFLVARMIRALYGLDYPDNQIMGRAGGNAHARRMGSLSPSKVDVDDPAFQIMACSDENGAETTWISRVNTNVKMYALGDQYGLASLQGLARTKVQFALDIAHQHGLDSPLGLRIESELLAELPLIYDSTCDTDRALRDLLLAHVHAHWLRLARSDALLLAISLAPIFAVELVAAASPTAMYSGKCRRCRTSDKWSALRVRCVCGNSETVTGAGGC